jgi:hypothetical protein
MKHILRIIFALVTITILYFFLKKNKLVEGHGGIGGHRGLLSGYGYGYGYHNYDALYYQSIEDLCYDSLGNLTYCLTPTLTRPSFFY